MSAEQSSQKFRPIQNFLHVLVLWSFAVTQPLYAKVAENLPFLLAHRIDGSGVIIYSLILLLPVPLALGALVWSLYSVSELLGRLVRALVWLVLGFFVVFPVLGNTMALDQTFAIFLSCGLSLLLVVANDTKFIKGLLDLLTPAPLVFAVFFLVFSPANIFLFDGTGQGDGDGRDRIDVPVIMVMLDEFPTHTMLTKTGDLDRDRLPGFARLAEVGTWYSSATTVAEATVMAVPAALSGVLPMGDRKQPPVFQHFPENIFDQVSSQRRIWAIENGTRLCRPERCEFPDVLDVDAVQDLTSLGAFSYGSIVIDSTIIWGHMSLPDRLRLAWLPELGAQWQGFFEGHVAEAEEQFNDHEAHAIRWNQRMLEVEAFMASLDWVGPGSFHYLHTLMPHAPWIHLPDGRIYDLTRAESIFGMVPEHANDTGIKHMWYDADWPTVIAEQRYLLQLQFVDQLIGRILDHLQDNPHFDDLMLIVTADHGSAFTAGTSRRALTDENLAEVLSIPLFVKYPGQREGGVDPRPVELLDVAPTIRDVLGLDTEGLDGSSLLVEDSPESWPRLVDDQGDYRDLDRTRFEQHFAAVTGRMHHRFEWSDVGYFPRIAEFSHLYGLAVSDLATPIQASDQSLQLTGGGQWQQVNLDSRFLPARIVGQLRQPEDDGKVFLSTVNGQIAGFSRVYNYPGANNTLEIMLQPEYFVQGRNVVEVFRMREIGGVSSLERVFSNAEAVRLVPGADARLALQIGTDTTIAVTEGPPFGNVRLVYDPDQDLYILQGWALDPISSRVAAVVRAFVNEELVGSTVPSERRPGLVDRFGSDALINAGFRIPLPLRVDPDGNYGVLRVIAIDEKGKAAQLPITGIIDGGFPFVPDLEFRPVRIPDRGQVSREPGHYIPGVWIEPASEDFRETAGVMVKGSLTGSDHRIRWTSSELQVCFMLDDPNGDFRLEFEGLPFIHPPEVEKQEIIVSINQETIGRWLVTERLMQMFSADIGPIPDLGENEICIDFSMPDAVVPSVLGISDDRRELGLALRRLRLVHSTL